MQQMETNGNIENERENIKTCMEEAADEATAEKKKNASQEK